MDPQQEIQQLTEFEGRAPGTDAERRAARHLATRLEQLGREAEVESTTIWPRSALTHTIHAVLGVVGGVLAVSAPFPGALIVLFAVASTFGDLTGSFFLVRRLTGSRASQNVVSPGGSDKPGALYLVAHCDAGRGGMVFGRLWERRAAYSQRVRRPLGAYEPFFWSLVVVLVCCVIRLLGVDATPITVVQFIATIVLIVSVPLLLDNALSSVSPGANDNASGVATALRLAERFGDGSLDHLDVHVLFTGAQEAQMLGMRSFLKRHKSDLDPARTIFLNIDEVGAGTVRFITREGYVFTYPYHPNLIELCEEIADGDEDGRFRARGLKSRGASDAHAARSAGFPALSVSCLGALDYAPHHHRQTDTPENIDAEALERAYGFCSELIELIDERIGPDLSSEGKTELSQANG